MVFILGAKGNEWAWKNNDWDNVEQFEKVQRNWMIAGVVFYGIVALLFIMLCIIGAFSSAGS